MDREIGLVRTMHINPATATVHGPTNASSGVEREPEFLLFEDTVTVGGTCDVGTRGCRSTVFVVLRQVNFRFRRGCSGQMELS